LRDNEMSIRTLSKSDLSQVVKIHLRSFEGFFLTFLGPRFLHLYYGSIVDFGQIGIVEKNDDSEVVGFVTGIDNGYGFFRKLIRRRVHLFALATVPAFIRKPSIALRLLRAFFRRSASVPNSVTLTSIGVLPEHHGAGAGHRLFSAFVETSRDRGFEKLLLETDAMDNTRVNNFYLRQGMRLSKAYKTHEGRKMNEYILDL